MVNTFDGLEKAADINAQISTFDARISKCIDDALAPFLRELRSLGYIRGHGHHDSHIPSAQPSFHTNNTDSNNLNIEPTPFLHPAPTQDSALIKAELIGQRQEDVKTLASDSKLMDPLSADHKQAALHPAPLPVLDTTPLLPSRPDIPSLQQPSPLPQQRLVTAAATFQSTPTAAPPLHLAPIHDSSNINNTESHDLNPKPTPTIHSVPASHTTSRSPLPQEIQTTRPTVQQPVAPPHWEASSTPAAQHKRFLKSPVTQPVVALTAPPAFRIVTHFREYGFGMHCRLHMCLYALPLDILLLSKSPTIYKHEFEPPPIKAMSRLQPCGQGCFHREGN